MSIVSAGWTWTTSSGYTQTVTAEQNTAGQDGSVTPESVSQNCTRQYGISLTAHTRLKPALACDTTCRDTKPATGMSCNVQKQI